MKHDCSYIYNCPKVSVPPKLDGRIDSEAWKAAPEIVLVRSETGAEAVKPTGARMCWDKDYLYVAFECTDKDIYGSFLNHDDPIYTEDVVEVFLSPDCDLTHYYELEVSPRNVRFDAEIRTANDLGDGMTGDLQWDCEGWKTAVLVDGTLDDRTDIDRGWKVEMAIPYAALGRKTPEAGEQWRVNLYRIDRSPEPVEHQAWSPTFADPAAFHAPCKFGTVAFVDAICQK